MQYTLHTGVIVAEYYAGGSVIAALVISYFSRTLEDCWWFIVLRSWVTAFTLGELKGAQWGGTEVISCDRRGWKSLSALWLLCSSLDSHQQNSVRELLRQGWVWYGHDLCSWNYVNPDLDREIQIHRIHLQLHRWVVINWYAFIDKLVDLLHLSFYNLKALHASNPQNPQLKTASVQINSM